MNKTVKESKLVTKKQCSDIEMLGAMRDEDIDTSDIPEITDWRGAVIGKFYRPIKKPVSIRIDADVLAWLKIPDGAYQTRINSILRRAMMEPLAKHTAKKRQTQKSA